MVAQDSLTAPGFDRPIELLRAHHTRIEQRCALLARLLEYLERKGGDEDARQTAGHILRYFDDAGKRHHEDEEINLFPALISTVSKSKREGLRTFTEELTAQHRDIATLWADIRQQLIAVRDGDSTAIDHESCRRLQGLYLTHMAREENELFPIAESLLDESAIADIGKCMAARRPPPPEAKRET